MIALIRKYLAAHHARALSMHRVKSDREHVRERTRQLREELGLPVPKVLRRKGLTQ
jgi:hypothetical protein